ncbi:MAG: DUF4345 family protein [Myxococcales bacterium]
MLARNARRIRQALLLMNAAIFGSIAVAALVAPRLVAPQYGYTLDSVESFAQFRAVFTGFWLGLTALMVTAARRVELTVLGDLAGLFILLQACARFASMALDGVPRLEFVGAAVGELLVGLTILVIKPRPAAGAAPE